MTTGSNLSAGSKIKTVSGIKIFVGSRNNIWEYDRKIDCSSLSFANFKTSFTSKTFLCGKP